MSGRFVSLGARLSRSRIHGSEGGSQQSCSITDSGWRAICSVGLTLVWLAGFSPNALAQGSFDFAVDAVRVEGNVNSSGSPDGSPDFQDGFTDNSLVNFPTSAFDCLQPVNESGGFLNLRSADGFNTGTPPFQVDNCGLGLGPGPSVWRLINGGGDSEIQAVFRADTPVPGAAYGLQLFTRGTQNENINIQVHGNGTTASIFANTVGVGPGPMQQVSLVGVSRIVLRLIYDDGTNQVAASFSTDGGASFTPLSVPSPGTVTTLGSEAVVSVFGSVISPPTTALQPPTFPIVLVHGICSDNSTWEGTKDALEQRGFDFGDVLDITSPSLPANGDFYTVKFQNPRIEDGIADWADQLTPHFSTLSSLEGPGAQFIVVAHSAGGLASRAYLQLPQAGDKFHHLITYGTPHQGSFAADTWLRHLFPLVCDFRPGKTQGAIEMEENSPLPFLNNLNAQKWDPDPLYTSLIGNWASLSDLIVTIDSQNMRNVGAPNHTGRITTRHHGQETSDFVNILCAINRDGLFGQGCLCINVNSPVDVVVRDPSGGLISKSSSNIDLAQYEEIEDEGGNFHDVVTFAVAAPGQYSIEVIPEPGASPSDTFSITMERNGATTVLADNVQVGSISGPFNFAVAPTVQVGIDVAPGTPIAQINLNNQGTLPVGIVSSQNFDATALVDQTSLTFGRTGYELSLDACRQRRDINGDGLRDLVCHFSAPSANFQPGDTTAVLRGATVDGTLFTGEELVIVR